MVSEAGILSHPGLPGLVRLAWSFGEGLFPLRPLLRPLRSSAVSAVPLESSLPFLRVGEVQERVLTKLAMWVRHM